MPTRKRLFIGLITALLIGCSSAQKKETTSTLKLRVQASFAGLVGYGTVYKGAVIEVLQGAFYQDSVAITVLVTDTLYSNILSNNQHPRVLDISFSKENENVPYSIMPITGLVDDNKTAWIIDTVRVQE